MNGEARIGRYDKIGVRLDCVIPFAISVVCIIGGIAVAFGFVQ